VGRYPAPNKAEKARIEAMMKLGCIVCDYFGAKSRAQECHHIVEGNKRLGHWYTLPLDRICHSEINAITKGGEPSERQLWERVQLKLMLPIYWPKSKILPRRTA
jgi:hypothetical protein